MNVLKDNDANCFKKRKQEVFGKIFEFRFDENKYKFAKCKLCEAKEKKERIIKMKDGNTTGIIRHLRKNHQDEYRKSFLKETCETSREVIVYINE